MYLKNCTNKDYYIGKEEWIIGSYLPYHIHTKYSLLDSCTSASEYIKLAVEDGAKAISFSEHGKPLNWCEKWAACKNAGIRYIHSVEIYLTESLEQKVRDNYHTILMAKNMDGVREINNLVKISCDKDHFYYNNRISFDEFLSISDNIISTSACLASPLNRLDTSHPKYMKLAMKYDFLEVQPHNHPDQIEYNKKLKKLSDKLGKPLIAGTDSHSSTSYKAECRDVLLEAKHKAYDDDGFDLTFKTYEELVEMFEVQGALSKSDYMQAISNTNILYDLTEDIDLDTSIKYPILYGSREADSIKFTETIERKFAEKLDSGIIPREQEEAFRKSIDEEMRVFQKLKMDGFMLSMSELISWCRDNDIPIGPARGSVGGSRVAYVADIIDLNPERWHTVFSRFANEDRTEIGDIDIDCIESDRPAIFNHIIERFGADKTARVASFGTLKAKATIDEIGRCLAQRWAKAHPNDLPQDNPWSLPKIAAIKKEITPVDELAKSENKPITSYNEYKSIAKKYPELFYYFDGLFGVTISQSVHPAGMVISPITLADNYGVFDKDGETCMLLDMDNIHDYTGLAKYDFLVLKTVQVIKETCDSVGIKYPREHEINWCDENVWNSMLKSSTALFQFESAFAFQSLQRFKPKSIFDMAIVNACIRPSGSSYRDDLLSRKIHKNPSKLIDDLLKDNLGYLIYQEDTIKFLQEICGLSGSEADNVRRAIGRKQKERLDKAMPDILEGYCSRSSEPRDVAEHEAKEFLQVISDSANYQFGYNHAIAYCKLGYLCAYLRHYYPIEFITSFLNNAANEDDIRNGTAYANRVGIKVTMPKWGISRSNYAYDKDQNIISKGLSSVKYIGSNVGEKLYEIAHQRYYKRFIDVLAALDAESVIDSRQLDVLIKIDFFSMFGNQRELMRISDIYVNMFKKGSAKQISRVKVEGTPMEEIVKKYAVGVTKSGGVAKSYTLLDVKSILEEAEDAVKDLQLDDLGDVLKVKNFKDAMGYAGYVSNKPSDRRKLYVMEVYPLVRHKDNKQFGYSVVTKSIGSGVESRFTVKNYIYNKDPIHKDDIIYCSSYEKNAGYFYLTSYYKVL